MLRELGVWSTPIGARCGARARSSLFEVGGEERWKDGVQGW